MKLKDVNERGFYYCEKEGKDILFEIYPNEDYMENFDSFQAFLRLISQLNLNRMIFYFLLEYLKSRVMKKKNMVFQFFIFPKK